VISIVIVNWNSGGLLENCVRSLLRNAAGCQIIVVDNASTDSSLLFFEQMQDGPVLIRNSRNVGFAAGSNLGWRAGEGSLLLFLNPDTECFPGSIDRLEQTLIADKEVWAAGGQLISPSGTPQEDFNVRAFPSVAGVAAEMLLIEEIWNSIRWFRPDRRTGSACEADVDQPAAACLMVSREALETVGGFDEEFRPAWFEDVDLCRRIRNHGGRIRYQPEARFLHHGGYSLAHLAPQSFLEHFHRNQIRYFRKHHGERAASHVKRLIVAGLLMRSVVSIAYPLVPHESRAASAKSFWNAARLISKLSETEL